MESAWNRDSKIKMVGSMTEAHDSKVEALMRISNFSDQIPFIFDGGAVCDLHLHLSQDAVPCHSRAKKKTVDPEEEDAKEKDYENSDEENGNHCVERYESSSSSVFDFSASHSARDSGLPSANDVFSQISGSPEFLNNRTEADEEATARDAEHAKRVVMEAKPHLVGIHERVRNDIDAQPS
ncbi:hypothetical protein DY000_02038951 [Brassica cretica]|uniref:Uncharacterized protein n=1 Tax=Brassica cretica TaxID=69181 RepID=A0ABQ7BBN5_BRACR|nr:hypothetical protein DY000_02038951 [Brassica cretica]